VLAAHQPGHRGFTLLELLIVVAVLAVVGAIGVPQYVAALRTARVGKARQELVILAEAIDSYADSNGRLPLTLYQVGFGGRSDPWGIPYCFLNYKDDCGDGLEWAIAAGIVDPAAIVGSSATAGAASKGRFLSWERPQGQGQGQGVLQALDNVTRNEASERAREVLASLARRTTEAEAESLTDAMLQAPAMTFFAGVPTETTRRRDRYMFPLNTDYDLFSLGPDGRTAASLGEPVGQDDVLRANNGGFFGTAAEY